MDSPSLLAIDGGFGRRSGCPSMSKETAVRGSLRPLKLRSSTQQTFETQSFLVGRSNTTLSLLEDSNDNVKLDPVIAGIAAMIVVITFP